MVLDKFQFSLIFNIFKENSRIRDTKHLSTNADSSNIWFHRRVDQEYPKTRFFQKQNKSSKTQKLKNV